MFNRVIGNRSMGPFTPKSNWDQKTAQEIERMRLANELAALAMDYTRANMKPGMKESEVGAMYEGFVHSIGVGYQGRVEMARAFTLVWSGPGIRTVPGITRSAVGERTLGRNVSIQAEVSSCHDCNWSQEVSRPRLFPCSFRCSGDWHL